MLQSVRDPKNQVTQFRYDEARDLRTKLIYPDTTELTGWVYDNNGNVTTRPTIGGPKQTFGYDERNRPTAMRWDNAIDFSDFGYDDAGRMTSARNPYSTVTHEYDVAGRLTHDKQLLVTTLNVPPSNVPQPTALVSRQSHGGQVFDISLPLDGSIGTECRDGGFAHSYSLLVTFLSPVTVNAVRVSAGLGSVAGFSVSGTVVTVNLLDVSNAQSMTVGLTITSGGNTGEISIPMRVLVGDTNNNGVVNGSDKTQTQSYSGQVANSTNFRCDVNASGSITSADVSMVKANSGSGMPGAAPALVDVSYAYDGDGKRNKLSIPGTGYDYSYLYDGMGRLEKIYPTLDPPNPNPYYQYYYDSASNVLQRKNWRNGTAQFFDPDEINRVLERRISAIALNPTTQQPFSYEFSKERYGYDAMSRLRTTDRTLRSGDNTVEVRQDGFGYNDAGELTSAQYYRAPGGQPVRSVSYGLDNAGNRLSITEIGTLTYDPNPLNQYASSAAGVNVSNGLQHEINVYGSVSYTYRGDTQLASARSTTAGGYELGYDALGRCVRRTTNGRPIYYVYDGARSILEYAAGGAVTGSVLYGLGIDEIIAQDNNGTTQWPLQDRLGSTSAVSDASGRIIEQYFYDAFGALEFRSGPGWSTPRGTLQSTSLINNRFLFTGREWVQAYGFYEYRARAYNPTLGRFMSEDPLGFAAGDTNLFRYCGGDPVNWTDPFGLEGWYPRSAPNIAPLSPRGQLFVSGVGNLTIGVIGGVGVAGLSTASYGLGTVAAVTVFGLASVFAGAKGISQIGSSIWGTPQQMEGANAMPTNLSSTTGSSALQRLEAIYSLTVALQNISKALTVASSLDLAISSNDLAGQFQNTPSPADERDPFGNVQFGLRVHGGGGGGEGAGSRSSGGSAGFGFGPFSPGPNSFTNSEGNSVFPGFGPGGFAIGVGIGGGAWSWSYEPPLKLN